MLVRLTEDSLIHVETGTRITIRREPYPAVNYSRVDAVSRADQATDVIDALDEILRRQGEEPIDEAVWNARLLGARLASGCLEESRR